MQTVLLLYSAISCIFRFFGLSSSDTVTTLVQSHLASFLQFPEVIPEIYSKFIMKKEKNIIKVQRYESPCGLLLLGSFGDKLCLCDWQVEKHRDHVDRRLKRMLCSEFEVGTSEVIEKAARQLDEFFAGKRKEFDVPLLFVGTDFQKTVWNELLEIPFGKTVSYGEMAQRIGMSKAVRAVANANGANSISIFAPCHRVIGSDRSLTGYGGGLPAKKFLLELESQPRLAL